jgi:hypothetical protein
MDAVGSTRTEAVSGHAAPAPAPRGSGLTIDRVWALLPVLVPVLVSMMSQMVAIDLAYHVRAGQLFLNTGHIPSVDTFTFSVAGKPWFDQQWGAQALLALTYRAGGWATVSFLRALLIGTTFGFVFLACRARGAKPAQASALSLAGFVVALQALAMRPQMFAITLFAASVWALATRGEHPRRVWLIPIFTVLWANLHGSFVLGPLLVGLAWIEALLEGKRSEARRLVLVGIATVLGTFMTPFGPLVWRYAYQLAANPVVRNNVSEWAPVTIRSFGGAAFFASGLAVAVFLARREGRARWADLLWLTVFFVLALPAVRGIVWWALIAPVIVAAYFRSKEPGLEDPASRHGTRLLNRLFVGVLLAAIVLALPWWREGSTSAMLSQAPVGLANAAGKVLPPGTRLFVSEPWGSWFEQVLPSIPVFVDPRIEIFPTSVWDDYTEIRAGGSRWQAIFDRWGIRAVVVDREDFPQLLSVMQASNLWTAVYQDHDGVLFVRNSVGTGL